MMRILKLLHKWCIAMVLTGFMAIPSAHAGLFFRPYVALDYRLALVPQTTNVVVPTGYGPFFVYPQPIIYPWLLGWRGLPWFYGFNDVLTYSYTALVPRVVVGWSLYIDPAQTIQIFDIMTEVDPTTGAILPLSDEVVNDFDVQSHTFSVNNGMATGAFSSPTLFENVSLTDALSGLGGDMSQLDLFFASEDGNQFLQAMNGTGRFMISSAVSQINVPEPGMLPMMGIGLVVLSVMLRKRTQLGWLS